MSSNSVSTDADIKLSNIVRRYVDLPKFIDLLHSRTMYFRRADGFPDKFEGALTPAIRKAMDDAKKQGLTKEASNKFYKRGRIGNFVSCWSIGARDNMALWQLYGGLKTCIAITSTVKKLVGICISWEEPVLIHRVKYIDHVKNPDMVVGHYSDMLRFKHEAYAYEKELRLIVPRQNKGWERNPPFLRLPLSDLDDLIRSVVVAPEAEDWFFDAISSLCEKYELGAPVRRSKLAFMPI